MEFNMHESGLNCYNPTDKSVVLINTVSKNYQVLLKSKLTVQIKQKLCTPNSGINQLNNSGGLFRVNK